VTMTTNSTAGNYLPNSRVRSDLARDERRYSGSFFSCWRVGLGYAGKFRMWKIIDVLVLKFDLGQRGGGGGGPVVEISLKTSIAAYRMCIEVSGPQALFSVISDLQAQVRRPVLDTL